MTNWTLLSSSRQLMTNTPHCFRTASVPSYGRREGENGRRTNRKSRNSLMMVSTRENLFYQENAYNNDTL